MCVRAGAADAAGDGGGQQDPRQRHQGERDALHARRHDATDVSVVHVHFQA